MDQNVLECLKRKHWWKFLQDLLNATENEDSIMGCLKQISVKDIAYG